MVAKIIWLSLLSLGSLLIDAACCAAANSKDVTQTKTNHVTILNKQNQEYLNSIDADSNSTDLRSIEEYVEMKTREGIPGFRFEHPVLQVTEFEDIPNLQLSDSILKQLNAEPAYPSKTVGFYASKAHCFLKAELSAARQFRNRVIGLSETQIFDLVGFPSVKTASLKYWKDAPRNSSDYLYFLGYEYVPVRLIVSQDKCVTASVLSKKEFSDFCVWAVKQYWDAQGKSRSEIFQSFGTPELITKISPSCEVLSYRYARRFSTDLTMINGRCVSEKSILQFGIKTAGAFDSNPSASSADLEPVLTSK